MSLFFHLFFFIIFSIFLHISCPFDFPSLFPPHLTLSLLLLSCLLWELVWGSSETAQISHILHWRILFLYRGWMSFSKKPTPLRRHAGSVEGKRRYLPYHSEPLNEFWILMGCQISCVTITSRLSDPVISPCHPPTFTLPLHWLCQDRPTLYGIERRKYWYDWNVALNCSWSHACDV